MNEKPVVWCLCTCVICSASTGAFLCVSPMEVPASEAWRLRSEHRAFFTTRVRKIRKPWRWWHHCLLDLLSYRKEDGQVCREGHPTDGFVWTAVLTILLVFQAGGDDVEDPGNSWTVMSGSWGTSEVTKDDEEPEDDGGLLPSPVESLLDWHLVPENDIYDPLIKRCKMKPQKY